MPIRSFIALPIPEPMLSQLGDAAARMAYQDKSAQIRWVDQRNYHVTLAFLGERDAHELDQLADSLSQFVQQDPIDLSVTHLSPFPESRPKLIAAMIDKQEPLQALQDQVMKAIRVNGLLIEKRKFMPHITLGRYRHARKGVSWLTPSKAECRATIDTLVLYESVLTPSGAEYEPLYEFALGFPAYEL